MTRWLPLLLIALLAGPAGAAITLDSTACAGGAIASCPKGTISTASQNFVDSNAFSTSAGGQLVLAFATVENLGPPTLSIAQQSGTGSYSTAWTVVQDCSDPAPPGSGTRVAVWRAITSTALTTVVIRATWGGGSNSAGTISVFPFSSSSTTLGTSTCVNQTAAGVAGVTFSTTTSGSRLITGAMEGLVGSSTATANGSSTIIGPNGSAQFTDSFTDASVIFTGTGTGGSILIGGTWSASGQGASAGVEVLDAGGGGGGSGNWGGMGFWGKIDLRRVPDLYRREEELS